MTEVLRTIFIIGARLTDTLEVWVLGLMGLVIVFDLIVGIRSRPFLAFSIFQIVGLGAGYLWASWMASQQDISGPYAWAIGVGAWCISTVLFHVAHTIVVLISR